jgi:hypothetical protein
MGRREDLSGLSRGRTQVAGRWSANKSETDGLIWGRAQRRSADLGQKIGCSLRRSIEIQRPEQAAAQFSILALKFLGNQPAVLTSLVKNEKLYLFGSIFPGIYNKYATVLIYL